VVYPEGPEALSSGLRAHFATGGGKYRKILPQRLTEHLPVYATTVHRSQGSEYQEVVLMLPERPSPVLTRELLYTAITRARRRVAVWGQQELFLKAVETRIERSSVLQSLIHDACRVSPT
jgi:exodeoxyribonuclease V alpha subunit